ncbi:MAG: xanthine dehydrogenase family protein molybdopterin-binding subunit, partial [Acidobacteriota bacterium]|nr:xanthine dehydrogenase family protein molybdopterin-binding subunit [Acidobacteriota bacterium]
FANRFYTARPPGFLDIPADLKWGAVGIPDPQDPVGAKGIGEPPQGSGAGAVLSAIADAIGDEHLRRTPVTPDMILSSLEMGPDGQFTAHIG